MPDPTEGNGWNTWSKHVLLELERLDKLARENQLELRADLKEIQENVSGVKTDVTILKAKAALLGAFAGTIGAAIVQIIERSIK